MSDVNNTILNQADLSDETVTFMTKLVASMSHHMRRIPSQREILEYLLSSDEVRDDLLQTDEAKARQLEADRDRRRSSRMRPRRPISDFSPVRMVDEDDRF